MFTHALNENKIIKNDTSFNICSSVIMRRSTAASSAGDRLLFLQILTPIGNGEIYIFNFDIVIVKMGQIICIFLFSAGLKPYGFSPSISSPFIKSCFA